MYLPGHGQKRQIILLTVCEQAIRQLFYVIPDIDDQACRMALHQMSGKFHKRLLRRKAEPRRDRKFLSPEMPYDRRILDQMHPADRVGPAVFSRQILHPVAFLRGDHHILYRKTHPFCLLFYCACHVHEYYITFRTVSTYFISIFRFQSHWILLFLCYDYFNNKHT